MTYQSPRIYTYKITFEEVSYYYYGVHKEKKFGEYYMGSPYTHKWMWKHYTPKKQILEFFEYTDDGWIEAQEVEKRLIRPFYNDDKWCLNENVGGRFSIEHQRRAGRKSGVVNGKKAGQKCKELGLGICGLSYEERVKYGKIGLEKQKELGVGIYALTPEQMTENGKKAGKIGGKIGGKISGKKHKENKTGICGRSKEQIIEDSKKGSKKTNSQKWMCEETGYITTSGPLTWYQRKRGIDTSKRKRIA
jgi:hypothetical protein